VRWDELPGGDVDRAIEVLRANGYAPYILLEDWEEPAFRQRFAASNGFGRIDWPPAMEYGDGQPYIRIWAPDDRARFRAGLPIVTDKVPKRPRTSL
jgi:hypothetical protein